MDSAAHGVRHLVRLGRVRDLPRLEQPVSASSTCSGTGAPRARFWARKVGSGTSMSMSGRTRCGCARRHRRRFACIVLRTYAAAHVGCVPDERATRAEVLARLLARASRDGSLICRGVDVELVPEAVERDHRPAREALGDPAQQRDVIEDPLRVGAGAAARVGLREQREPVAAYRLADGSPQGGGDLRARGARTAPRAAPRAPPGGVDRVLAGSAASGHEIAWPPRR